MIYLLCCLRPRVHMELRKGRKRTLKVREMAEVEEVGLVNIWSVRGSRRLQRGRCRESEKVCEV